MSGKGEHPARHCIPNGRENREKKGDYHQLSVHKARLHRFTSKARGGRTAVHLCCQTLSQHGINGVEGGLGTHEGGQRGMVAFKRQKEMSKYRCTALASCITASVKLAVKGLIWKHLELLPDLKTFFPSTHQAYVLRNEGTSRVVKYSILFYSGLCPATAGSSCLPESSNSLCPLRPLSMPIFVAPQCHPWKDVLVFQLICRTLSATLCFYHDICRN